jgi:hypothetical protein
MRAVLNVRGRSYSTTMLNTRGRSYSTAVLNARGRSYSTAAFTGFDEIKSETPTDRNPLTNGEAARANSPWEIDMVGYLSRLLHVD